MADKRPALGRGLSALIPQTPAPAAAQAAAADRRPNELDIDLLTPNPLQPRQHIDEPALDELAQSIRSHGVIQPILVRRVADRFEIVAGERRWRAAQRAGLLKVPVVFRDVPDDKLLEVALIENIQREDLNPIEEAQAYRRLSDDLSRRTGAPTQRYRDPVILAELEVFHSRPIAPTRRVALGRRHLPLHPAPGFGGILLGGIAAASGGRLFY